MFEKHIVAVVLLFVVAGHGLGQDVLVSPHTSLRMANEEEVADLAFSGDGKMLLAGDEDGTVECWDVQRKVSIGSAKLKSSPKLLAFLPGDKTYVGVDADGNVTVFDLLQGPTGTSFKTKGRPERVALDAGKQYLAIATGDERIELFDLKALMPAGVIDARDKIDDLLFLGFDRLGQQLVAITQQAGVVSWNPATLKPIREITLGGGELHGSRSVVHSASTNRATNIFVVALEEVALPKGGIHSGRDLVRENSLIAYDWNSGFEIKRVKTNWTAERIVLGPGNDHVSVINDEDNTITLVDLRKGELGSSMTMTEKPRVLAVSEDNGWLAAGSKNGDISVWKLQFRGEASVKAPSIPTLAGRIRSLTGSEPALSTGAPVRMAVIAFEAKGVSQDVAEICVSSMSTSLANFNYITLVERKHIESIIKEQQFQLSDLTQENGVEVGRLLNADIVLFGDVGRLGTSLVFAARLISVETGKVIAGRQVVCEECRDQDIYDAINMLVSTIAQ